MIFLHQIHLTFWVMKETQNKTSHHRKKIRNIIEIHASSKGRVGFTYVYNHLKSNHLEDKLI